jgi:dipeptidase E
MKLILSSCDFMNENSKQVILENLDKKLSECKVLFIPNEKATKEKINSNKYYERLKTDGFENKNNIYIFDESRPNDFRNLDIDLIYVSGGNTFATLDKLRKCDFDKEIVNYVNNGVTYIGGSCGAQIVTSNIKHVEAFDENYVNMEDFKGLCLFDGILFCHYDESRKKNYDEALNGKYKVYKLTDDDSIVIKDSDIKIYKF